MTTGYKTKQKERIQTYVLASAGEHFTAADVMAYLASEGERIGAATVYRHLDKLVEQGLVRKYTLEEGASACYQYVGKNEDCQEHFHLKCVQCGALLHVGCDFLNQIDRHIFERHGFAVDQSKTVFYGRCEKCILKEGEQIS